VISLAALVLLVFIYLLVLSRALDFVVPSNRTLSALIADDVIVNRALLFAPSLCLVVFGIGLVALTFVNRVGGWGSGLIAILAASYAVLHVPLTLVFNFVPGLTLPAWWRVVFLSSPSGFVLLYWLIVVTTAGVKLPYKEVWAVLVFVADIILTLAWLRHG
jgi:hypothetical protein